MNRLALFVVVAFALTSLGCTSEPEPEAPSPTTVSAPAPAPQSADPTVTMARAVGDGKPGAAVDLHYEFAAKPEVGVPLELQLVLVPRVAVGSLSATIAGMDGVTVAGDLRPSFENVEPGKTYEHTVTLLPERAGVYYITVAVTSTIGGASVGRTFSIPFIADAQAPAQRKAEPPQDASGQPIESMKAEER